MSVCKASFSIALLFIAAACELATGTVVTGGKRQNNPEDIYACSVLVNADEKSFCDNVWLVSRSVGCIQCHASETSPLHASDDPKEAFREVLAGKKINFSDPALSALVEKIKNGHQQWGPGTEKANQVSALFLKGIQKFADERGANLQEAPHPYVTSSVIFPNNIPVWDTVGATFPIMEIPLDNLVSSGTSSKIGIAGAKIRFRVAQIGDVKKAYLLREIRLVSSVPVEIKNGYTLINGNVRQTDQTFTGVNGTASANAANGVTLPGMSEIAVIEMGEGGPGIDTLAFSFEMLKVAEGPSGPPLVNTQPAATRLANLTAMRNYINTACISCHGNASQSDGVNFASFINATANASLANIDALESAIFAATMTVSGNSANARGLPLLVRGKPEESVLYVSVNARAQTPVAAASVSTSAGTVATSPMPNNDQAATKSAAQTGAAAIRKFLTEVR